MSSQGRAAPPLTVGLPVYNGARYLAQSIDSLLAQSYTDFDLVISDNASSDDTAEICREYERKDARVRYVRQPTNIGAAPNHAFLAAQAGSKFFKWAAADDLYAADLLSRCVQLLEEHPEAVLAHSWTAAVDEQDDVTQAYEYPLSTHSPSAPERFRSMLFGVGDDVGIIRADDQYGVIRTRILRSIPPQGSYYHSDRTITTELCLHGPFYQVPQWLYFRRDHRGRPQYTHASTRAWCTNLDPRRADRLRHPAARLYGAFVYGYVSAIRRAPISTAERRSCYSLLARWVAERGPAALLRLSGKGGPSANGFDATRPPPPEPSALAAAEAALPGPLRAGASR